MRGDQFIKWIKETNGTHGTVWVAEIGVKAGGTSVNLLRSLPNLYLYMVDPWESSPEYAKISDIAHTSNRFKAESMTDEFGNRRMFCLMTCEEWCKNKLSKPVLHWAILDANHDKVYENLVALWPLVECGIMGRHYRNTLPSGRKVEIKHVKDAVDRFCKEYGVTVDAPISGWRIMKCAN